MSLKEALDNAKESLAALPNLRVPGLEEVMDKMYALAEDVKQNGITPEKAAEAGRLDDLLVTYIKNLEAMMADAERPTEGRKPS